MEKLTYKDKFMATTSALALSATALVGCGTTVERHLITDPVNVKCDDEAWIWASMHNGTATFKVHGRHPGDVAQITVRRNSVGASWAVAGDVTGPPQQLGPDGFTIPTPIKEGTVGAVLGAFGAGGAWTIVISGEDTVIMQGTCSGM